MRRKHPRRPAAPPRRTTVVPPELRDAYKEFVARVAEAEQQAEAESARRRVRPEEAIDLRGAVEVLHAHPVLETYLKALVQRDEARAQAEGRAIPTAVSYEVPGTAGFFPEEGPAVESFLQKRRGPPTGSHPQSQGGPTPAAWATGGSKNDMPQGVPNAQQLRYLADTNEWVRAAINIRRQQIGRADITVVPADERRVWNRSLQRRVQALLDQPNIYRDSYRTLIEPVIEDILVLDRGVLSKNMTPRREPVELYFEDGATIKIYTNWSGKDSEPRYLYEEVGTSKKVPLRNDQLICMAANPATYRTGLSPVQYLRKTIMAEMRAIESASHLVDMKPPPHIVQIPGAHQAQITNLRATYDSEVAGRKELFWMGGDQVAHVFPLTFSARDNQWLEWQQYLAKKIAIAFQISPQQFGFTGDMNRASAELQQQIYEDTGLIPLLLLLEEYLNRELLMDFCERDKYGRARLDRLNLRIVYPQVSEAERQLHAERASAIAAQALAGLPSTTLNQILMMKGEEPVPGGNTFWVTTAQGPVPWLTYDRDYGDYNPLAALGGQIGAQDPMGGPSPEEAPPEDPADYADQEDPRYPQQQPAAGQAAPAMAPAPTPAYGPSYGDESSAADTTFTPNLSAWRRRPDRRAPGKHWRPSYDDLAPRGPQQRERELDVPGHQGERRDDQEGVEAAPRAHRRHG